MDLLREERTLIELYTSLMDKFPQQRDALKLLLEDERRHYNILSKLFAREEEANPWIVKFYMLLSAIFGVYFIIKLIKRRKERLKEQYKEVGSSFNPIREILREEEMHIKQLDLQLKDERAKYIGSTVLGLNDALVEMTGSLTGLTFALQNSILIAISSLVVGVSAALSMAASEFLSRRAEGDRNPLKGAIYTGIAYISVVILLVTPFFLLKESIQALLTSLGVAISLVAFFSWYISVVRETSSREEFFTMVTLSLGVAFVAYLVGEGFSLFLGISR